MTISAKLRDGFRWAMFDLRMVIYTALYGRRPKVLPAAPAVRTLTRLEFEAREADARADSAIAREAYAEEAGDPRPANSRGQLWSVS